MKINVNKKIANHVKKLENNSDKMLDVAAKLLEKKDSLTSSDKALLESLIKKVNKLC